MFYTRKFQKEISLKGGTTVNSRKWETIGYVVLLAALFAPGPVRGQEVGKVQPKPRVVVFGINGAEWDIIKPLLLRGEMPNLARVIERGVSGKMRIISAPNCPKIYSIFETSTPPQE